METPTYGECSQTHHRQNVTMDNRLKSRRLTTYDSNWMFANAIETTMKQLHRLNGEMGQKFEIVFAKFQIFISKSRAKNFQMLLRFVLLCK